MCRHRVLPCGAGRDCALEGRALLAAARPGGRNATITRFNAVTHEHTLVFHDLAQTTLHLRLYHFQFLDWDVLPRRRAAMLAPRAAVTMMMVMDRVLLKLQRSLIHI